VREISKKAQSDYVKSSAQARQKFITSTHSPMKLITACAIASLIALQTVASSQKTKSGLPFTNK
jgi:hypothetical protein